ncbi:MAG: asparagine synthase-related protein [Thiobacillus sp.]|nr:asparagine synthase-related protein [Thiobacillus sp.]
MPGILCSAYDPADETVEPKWRRGLEWVYQPAHIVERYSEPGFQLACIYHPGVCQGSRILVTERHVLALYGNIYNDDLHGADGDALCRILLDRFVQGGAARLQHLDGRYDIAVWNRHARVLHFISDRFGANRHYALRRPGALHLACEVKALAVSLDRIEVDPAGLASLLGFGYNLGDLTLLRGVKCLPQARHIEFRPATDTFRMERYWNYPYGELETRAASEAELAEALHQHLARALQRRMHNVEKVLLPLSGGLDARTMAGLLAQSNYPGEVLSYSYGQASSRDVRYGRAIARKLGYRHIHIPTPADFMTRHLEQAAWRFDGEWPADSNWGARFSHTHPILGDLRGYTVLSGFMGDIILGSDRYHYRSKTGDIPLGAGQLADIFFASVRDMPIDGLFDLLAGEDAESRIAAIVNETFEPLQTIAPFLALLRSEFLHRQRRHTATIAQSVEYDLKIITPFLDRDVVDFSMLIPLAHYHDKSLYKHMIRNHLPKVASVPYANTGLPLADAPLRHALKWRADRLMKHFPEWQRRLKRRNEFFDFRGGVLAQAGYFKERIPLLASLSPPLVDGAPAQRMADLLSGKIKTTEQASALLPPAYFLRALGQALDSGR